MQYDKDVHPFPNTLDNVVPKMRFKRYRFDVVDFGARLYNPYIGRFLGADPKSDKYSQWSSFSFCINNPIKNIDIDGKDIIAPAEASKQLLLSAVTYRFGKNHGYLFESNRFVHNGNMPTKLSEGQQKVYNYFNDNLVNSSTISTIKIQSGMLY